MKAFPKLEVAIGDDNDVYKSEQDGMDLRDYFAAKAMEAILTGQWNITTPEKVAERAYIYADKMLEERKPK